MDEHTIHQKLDEILDLVRDIYKKESKIMGDVTKLQDAMTKLVTDVAAAVTEIKDLLAQIAAVSDDQAAVDALTAQAIQAASDLEAAMPAPVAPPVA